MAFKDGKTHRLSIVLVANIAWVLIGACICAFAMRLRVWDASGPSTGFVPLLMGGLIALCGLAMLGTSARNAPSLKQLWPTPGSALRPAAVVVGLVAMTAVMPWLGFLTSAFVLTLFLVRVVYREPWLWSILIAGLASIALTILFDNAFAMSLPRMTLGL